MTTVHLVTWHSARHFLSCTPAIPLTVVSNIRPPLDFTAAADPQLRNLLIDCLTRIMADSELVKVPQTNNLRHAVLYEAIMVIIHLETYVSLSCRMVGPGTLLQSRCLPLFAFHSPLPNEVSAHLCFARTRRTASTIW